MSRQSPGVVKIFRVSDDSSIPPARLTYHGHVAEGRFIAVPLAVLLVRLLLLLSVVLLLVKIVAVIVLRLDDGAAILEVGDGVGEESVGRGEARLVCKCQIVLIL